MLCRKYRSSKSLKIGNDVRANVIDFDCGYGLTYPSDRIDLSASETSSRKAA
jgi:hypothetical protein